MFRPQSLAIIILYNENLSIRYTCIFRGVYRVQGGKCKCEISQVWGVWRAWLWAGYESYMDRDLCLRITMSRMGYLTVWHTVNVYVSQSRHSYKEA